LHKIVVDASAMSTVRERFPGMDQSEIYRKLNEIFEDVFDDDSIVVSPELSAKDVDGWDSLTHIRLILTVEKAFKVKFSTPEIGKLEKVGDLVALIEARA
jgi:acyl carrier protein